MNRTFALPKPPFRRTPGTRRPTARPVIERPPVAPAAAQRATHPAPAAAGAPTAAVVPTAVVPATIVSPAAGAPTVVMSAAAVVPAAVVPATSVSAAVPVSSAPARTDWSVRWDNGWVG